MRRSSGLSSPSLCQLRQVWPRQLAGAWTWVSAMTPPWGWVQSPAGFAGCEVGIAGGWGSPMDVASTCCISSSSVRRVYRVRIRSRCGIARSLTSVSVFEISVRWRCMSNRLRLTRLSRFRYDIGPTHSELGMLDLTTHSTPEHEN